jgi:anti-sigma regulatory factor (Ser/Thr protein kinase)
VTASTITSWVVGQPYAPRAARQRARALCLGTAAPTLVEDVELVVSELVTNAMRHGVGEITMHLEIAPDRVVVGVRDEGDGRPSPRQPELSDLNGRGLAMVALLAADWGVRPEPHGGKVVWCVLTTAVSGSQ